MLHTSPDNLSSSVLHLTGRVAVESQGVDGAAGDAAQLVGDGRLLDVAAEILRSLGPVEAEEVSTEASDVGRSHGRARDGVLLLCQPLDRPTSISPAR